MRLTKYINNQFVCDKKDLEIADNYIAGMAIDKLGKLENMIEQLNDKNEILSKELEKLQLDGMSKTYQFREYMGMKLTNSRVLAMLAEYKII